VREHNTLTQPKSPISQLQPDQVNPARLITLIVFVGMLPTLLVIWLVLAFSSDASVVQNAQASALPDTTLLLKSQESQGVTSVAVAQQILVPIV